MSRRSWAAIVLRGMKEIRRENIQELENVKIALSLADIIRRDTDSHFGIFVWGPDGKTSAPANAHGRAVIEISKVGSNINDYGIGLLIFEEGKVHLYAHGDTYGGVFPNSQDRGVFELSNPDFPVTILGELYKYLTPYLGWEPVYERDGGNS